MEIDFFDDDVDVLLSDLDMDALEVADTVAAQDIELLSYQLEFMRRDQDKRVALVTGVGCGKSTVAAIWLIQQGMIGQNSIVSAQSFSALHKVMFREIQKQCRRMQIPFAYNKNDKTLTFTNGAVIYGASSEAPDAVLGLTDINNYLADEAAYTDVALRNNCEERCRGTWNGHPIVARYRYTTTPSIEATAEWFASMVKANPEIVIHATTYENTFLDPSFVEDQKKKYGGEDSPLFHQQILGEFLEGDAACVIIRTSEYPDRPTLNPGKDVFLGVDLAGSGDDSSVFMVANRREILEVVVNTDGKAITDDHIFCKLYEKWRPKAYAWDNTGGFGRNIEVLAETRPGGIPVNNASEDEDETVQNKRAGMYMRLRRAVQDGFYIDREKYPQIPREVKHTTFFVNGSGRVQIIAKDKIREKLEGRSPDTLDALTLVIEAMNASASSVVRTDQELSDAAERIARALG